MNAADNYQGPGKYRHYKGGEYEVLVLSIAEWTKPEGDDGDWDSKTMTMVIYRPLSEGSLLPGPRGQETWARPLNKADAAHTDKPDDYFNSMVPCFNDDDCAMYKCSCKATGKRPRFTYVGPMS